VTHTHQQPPNKALHPTAYSSVRSSLRFQRRVSLVVGPLARYAAAAKERIVGVHKNIGFDKFPKQGGALGLEAKVCFNYDPMKEITGVIVRDDVEEPGVTLIQLTDGRVILATECQYSYDYSATKIARQAAQPDAAPDCPAPGLISNSQATPPGSG